MDRGFRGSEFLGFLLLVLVLRGVFWGNRRFLGSGVKILVVWSFVVGVLYLWEGFRYYLGGFWFEFVRFVDFRRAFWEGVMGR